MHKYKDQKYYFIYIKHNTAVYVWLYSFGNFEFALSPALVSPAAALLSRLSLQCRRLLVQSSRLPLESLSLLRLVAGLPVHAPLLCTQVPRCSQAVGCKDHDYASLTMQCPLTDLTLVAIELGRHLGHPRLLPLSLILDVSSLSPIDKKLVTENTNLK